VTTIRLETPGRFAVVASDTPTPGPDDAVVRVHRIGVCGTDLHAFAGRQPFFTYPRILGHELGVEVVEVGRQVTAVHVGDRAAVEPYLDCGVCIACRAGRTNCCDKLQVLGVHVDGGMRPLLRVPARKLHTSASLTFDQLALVETLAIGAHAVKRGQLQQSDKVLVVGAGPIGLAVMQSAMIAGCRPIVLDLDDARLAFCRDTLGVADTLRADSGDLHDQLRAAGEGDDLPTVVFDATGHAASMRAAVDRIAPGGRVIYVGLFIGDLCVDDPTFHRREATLLASRNATAPTFAALIRLIESGRLDTAPWITHRLALDTLPDTFAGLRGSPGLVKAMIEVA
jgi:2-desacetyl-2-hydroxyethyl bacteriochlorophyllide A dehydrogenase